MGVSLESGVIFQKNELWRGISDEAKVSESHERGVILGRRFAGKVVEDTSKWARRLREAPLFRKTSL